MEIIGKYYDYREYLKDELARRTHANSQYSMRAFARDIKVSPQMLSLVMNGSKNVSSEFAVEMGRGLGLRNEELSYFHDLVDLTQAKSDHLKEVIRFRLSRYDENTSYRVLQEDIFKIISDWHHFAILELSFTKGFKKDINWIAKRLGLSSPEVKQAVERLLKFELLEESGKTWKKTEVNISSTHEVPSAAVKKMTTQLLEKAAIALQEQTLEERDFGTMTMAIDPEKIPAAKKKIKKFRRELTEYLENGNQTEVYTFSSQLFKLTE